MIIETKMQRMQRKAKDLPAALMFGAFWVGMIVLLLVV